MKKTVIYTLLFLISLLFISSPISAARSQPFLGIGLDRIAPEKNPDGSIKTYGRTIYEMQDMNELGPVWVYNWTLPKPNQNYSNDPYQDFGGRFIPMVFGCGASANATVMNWIKLNTYEGYVLFLNEPDNSGAGGGSACLPQTAVSKLDNFIALKNEYKQQTGKTIDIIFGGMFWGPDMCMPTYNWCGKVYNGKFWIDDFIDKWRASHNQADPDIAGMHFHVYPWNPAAKNTADLMAHFKRRMEGGYDPVYRVDLPGWNDWLDRNTWARGTKDQLWITETGILDGSISKSITNGVLAQLIPYLESNNRIDRVAWFVYDLNHKAGYAPGYAQTALMNLDHTTRSREI